MQKKKKSDDDFKGLLRNVKDLVTTQKCNLVWTNGQNRVQKDWLVKSTNITLDINTEITHLEQ